MRDEAEIRQQLERIEDRIDTAREPDKSHLIGSRNVLEWVLEER